MYEFSKIQAMAHLFPNTYTNPLAGYYYEKIETKVFEGND